MACTFVSNVLPCSFCALLSLFFFNPARLLDRADLQVLQNRLETDGSVSSQSKYDLGSFAALQLAANTKTILSSYNHNSIISLQLFECLPLISFQMANPGEHAIKCNCKMPKAALCYSLEMMM